MFEKALSTIRRLMEEHKELRLEEQKRKSGYSYWVHDSKGNLRRVFKLVNKKKTLDLEINVPLPEEFVARFPDMRNISREEAIAKHLGTMKHHYKSHDLSHLETVMRQVLASCKKGLS